MSTLGLFNEKWYLDQNPDVMAAAEAGLITPLDHLLSHGMYEGRSLGNGVDLAMFAGDPAFMQAMATGDLDAALGRVNAVAPFVPGFERPQGWVPAADTPIPLDFVPPAGTLLVVPPEITVPEGVTLPDTFEQKPGGGGGGGSILEVNDIQTFTAATRVETTAASGEDPAVFGQIEVDLAGISTGVIYFRLDGDTSSTTHRYSGLTPEQIVAEINADGTLNTRIIASIKDGTDSMLVLRSVDPARSLDGG